MWLASRRAPSGEGFGGLQLVGDWGGALAEVTRAMARSRPEPQSVGEAYYRRGEIHRLRGERAAAEKAYHAASRAGREPQPGLALLRVAEGRAEAACSALRRILDATTDPLRRARYLPACVEILLAGGVVDAADRAATELEQIAGAFGTELLDAQAALARGQVLLARDDPGGAIPQLRTASEAWHRADLPYLGARTRALLGRACEALEDTDGAELEFEAAREVFARLGAAPDLEALPAPPSGPIHGLTPRELEVLRHVAVGRTNKEIARALFLSVKTVDRHVSNLLAKLDLPSRAAATAWAYQHDLAGHG